MRVAGVRAAAAAKLAKRRKKDPVAEQKIEAIITATPAARGRLAVLLVGAGGNGARIMPPLMQMLRQRDFVAVLDHDIVEDRNLARQHFRARDIGQHKATVLANRYHREGVASQSFAVQLTQANAVQVATEALAASQIAHDQMVVLIGCVDNNATRAVMSSLSENLVQSAGWRNVAWIDVGNENRAGQVIMSIPKWQMDVSDGAGNRSGAAFFTVRTMAQSMPQLLRARPEEAAEASCGDRIDIQTVMVNHMAAGAAINCLSWLMLGIPFAAPGSFFSTLNIMQPIRMTKVLFDARAIETDMAFAHKG